MIVRKPDYVAEIALQHNEVPASVNLETGEIKVKKPRGRPKGTLRDKDKQVWLPNSIFYKHYPKTWEWLEKQTTPIEFKCAVLLGIKAEAYTNSLKPLDDDSSYRFLSEQLGISLGLVEYTVKKLFTLGVFGRFEVYKPEKPFTKYWLFNPYLSFNGRVVDKDIAALFEGTYCHKAFQGLDFIVVLPEKKKIKTIE